MEVQILFNSEAITGNLSIGWGFSCLVNKHILFDTGEKAEYLFNNMKNMNIDISSIDAVVISHDHWDHTGGLWETLKRKKGLTVYACPNSSINFKEKVKKLQGTLVEAEGFSEIPPLEIAKKSQGLSPGNSLNSSGRDIFITGEIQGIYHDQCISEQALVVKTKNGITAITGCAHPGIINIVEKIKNEFPSEQFYLVFGGFHLMNKDSRAIEAIVDKLKEMGIKKAGPTHCSGKEAERIFAEKYKDNLITVKAGQVLNI